MAPKQLSFKTAKAAGYLDDLSLRDRKAVFARIATGRPPVAPSKPSANDTTKRVTAKANITYDFRPDWSEKWNNEAANHFR